MTTFKELCGDDYSALVAYEPYLPLKTKGFLNHMALEPDREMSEGQERWAVEILNRAIIQERLNNGQCALPETLD